MQWADASGVDMSAMWSNKAEEWTDPVRKGRGTRKGVGSEGKAEEMSKGKGRGPGQVRGRGQGPRSK